MKLRNIRNVGRFRNEITKQEYNVKIGRRQGRSTDHYFYLYRGKRMFINDADYFNNHTKIEEQ